MGKIVAQMLVTYEYTPNPKVYPEGSYLEDMMKIDKENFEKDPWFFLDMSEDIHIALKYVNEDSIKIGEVD